ncbi:HET-domain-containing protein [Fusarium austroafricanum]|uniref:HET-domain-containing protein n=1 Tax=Fusarium austroafricanum TaxID=2364996 RepID=A0A8H4KJC5_9HYPO|nr:HET-domain-containing protein [Fusarium austroafricanum]
MNPGFPYKDLVHASNEIRLLKLLRGSRNDNIECEFLPPVPLSNTITYEALSYTWGDATNLRVIKLDQRDFNVTPNLLAALIALRYADKSRILWIDAICINQDDDADKNYQVPLMSKIYTYATIVDVWLGPEGPGPSAFDILENSTISEIFGVEGPDGGPVAIDTWYSDFDDSPLRALHDLCHRAYWTRIWILQEVILAKKIHIYSGTRQVQGQILEAHLFALGRMRGLVVDEYSDDESDESDIVNDICGSQCHTILKNRPSQIQHKRPLKELLQKYWQNGCQNPRDKVYGLLSLANDDWINDLPIRYGQPLAFAYLDVLQSFKGKETQLPYLSQILQRAFGPHSREIPSKLGDHPQADKPGFIANRALNLWASAPLPIGELGPSLEEYRLKTPPLGGLTGKISPRFIAYYRSCVQEFFEEGIWRTLHTLDSIRDGERVVFSRAPPGDEGEIEDEYGLEGEIQPPPELDYKRLERPLGGDLPAELHPRSWNNYRFFSCQSMLGVTTSKVAEGDYISWVHGCYSAIVLRAEGDDFLLVGRAVFLRDFDRLDAREVFTRSMNLRCSQVPLSVFQLLTN